MKILIISTAAIPTPPPDDGYSGLERICAWLTFEFAKKGHDVTLVSAKGSPWEGSHPIMNGEEQIASMNVICTVNPSWNGLVEKDHYNEYKKLLEKDFSGPDSIVIDHTWWCYSYYSKQKFPDMNLLHTHHGLLGFDQPPPNTLFPRFLGLSTNHAHYMSNQLKIPVRHIHNGIPLTQFPEGYDFIKKGSFLLSLNRITAEKGIHDSIDIAIATKTPIILVGDDTKVGDQQYVNRIIERCRHSNGLAQYMGLVDNKTKNQLLQQCKAVISCPSPSWMEAFGLYATEAMNFYKPVIALANGGLSDIIQHGVTGFLANNPESLKPFVEKLDDIDPFACRQRLEENFSTTIMADNYLSLFDKVIKKESDAYW
jgi:glycosyltransferase involved in cell wall biosynthesis